MKYNEAEYRFPLDQDQKQTMAEIARRRKLVSNVQGQTRKVRLERELARYVRLLVTYRNPVRIIVFGSLATGDIHAWSDIDLVIIEATDLPFMQRLHQVRDLLRPTVATDILVYTPEEFDRLGQERPFVRDEILSNGRIVYERSG